MYSISSKCASGGFVSACAQSAERRALAAPDARPSQQLPWKTQFPGHSCPGRARHMICGMLGDPYVAHLGMRPSVDECAVHDHPHADPGADGDICHVRASLSRAPGLFCERRPVDVGVEMHRYPEGVLELRLRGQAPQAVFGVDRAMAPALRSNGPKLAMPKEASGPESACTLKNQSMADLVVDSGSVVAMTVSTQASCEPSPTARTHLVPPSSTPPYAAKSRLLSPDRPAPARH